MTDKIKRTALGISILGESTVGKTCVSSVFLGLEFREEHLATIGIDKMIYNLKMDDGNQVKLKIWDTAGQERFRALSLNVLKNSQAVVVVFDLTNHESFERVTDWLKQVRDYSKEIPIALFGNKSDLEGRKVQQEEIDTFVEKEHLFYFETSAKNNTGITEGFTKIANEGYKVFNPNSTVKIPKKKHRSKRGC